MFDGIFIVFLFLAGKAENTPYSEEFGPIILLSS